MNFAMPEDAHLGRVKERVVDWMNQLGQGTDWTIDGNDREAIDFSFEYEVIANLREAPIRIFLKQTEIQVLPSLSWINLSDQLVQQMDLPKGTLFRIYPVDGSVDNRDEEDHSCTFDWVPDMQYWFEIVYDYSKDMRSQSKSVIMVDASNRTDTLVVPQTADVYQVRDLWKRFMEVPPDIEMQMQTADGHEFYWSLETAKDPIPYSIKAANFHGDANAFSGPHQFVADQISRLLDVKVPPFALCQVTQRRSFGPRIEFDGEVSQLSFRILREHRLSWNIEGRILRAPQASTWWIPYNLEAIMRYGHTINTDIPEDPNEAEFPPLPWHDDVIIRIKSHAPPQVPAAPLPVDGSQNPPAPGSPLGWTGPALGQAPVIRADAAGLTGYTSPNTTRTVEGQQEELPVEELQLFRGLSQKNQLVHDMISWTTLESYPLRIGVSLPIPNPGSTEDFEEFHEAQLWEQTEDEWIIENDHAAVVYKWLSDRFTSRSTAHALPIGMPVSINEV
jgi:hypothetical protein